MGIIKKEQFVKNLGERIKRLRDNRTTVSQAEFAESAGLSERGLQGIENNEGPNGPGIYSIFKISQALGLTISELIGESKSKEALRAESLLIIFDAAVTLDEVKLAKLRRFVEDLGREQSSKIV